MSLAQWARGSAPDLTGRVALVTGASRGVGRGIAIGLGSCGATVIVTGRTAHAGQDRFGLGGSLHETAEQVVEAGGRCVAMVCDHADDRRVGELFERIDREFGQLDVLVNNAWGGYESIHTGERFEYPDQFWEQPLSMWDEASIVGVRGAFVCSWHSARRMVPRRRGLIVNVSAEVALTPDGRVVYGNAKASSARMVTDMSMQLRDSGVSAVCLLPGLVRTESVIKAANMGVFDLRDSESPELQGLAVAALAADPDILRHSGKAIRTAELGQWYGFNELPWAAQRSQAGRPSSAP